MAPATQRVSSLFPTTMSGGAAQKCSAQSQSPASRWERLIPPAWLHTLYTNYIDCEFSCAGVWVNRRTTASPLHESGKEQGDHFYLRGAPYAHLPLTTLHPPATEESPGTSGENNTLCTRENMIYFTINQSGRSYLGIDSYKWQELKLSHVNVVLIKHFTLVGQ